MIFIAFHNLWFSPRIFLLLNMYYLLFYRHGIITRLYALDMKLIWRIYTSRMSSGPVVWNNIRINPASIWSRCVEQRRRRKRRILRLFLIDFTRRSIVIEIICCHHYNCCERIHRQQYFVSYKIISKTRTHFFNDYW